MEEFEEKENEKSMLVVADHRGGKKNFYRIFFRVPICPRSLRSSQTSGGRRRLPLGVFVQFFSFFFCGLNGQKNQMG